MRLRIGYELQYEFPQPTPLILMLNVHFSRASDLFAPDHVRIEPSTHVSGYRDGFGNWCTRFLALSGRVKISSDTYIRDNGLPDVISGQATQIAVELLPEESLVFLRASRFCDSDRMLDLAWKLFGNGATGWARVQSICDYVHNRIEFGYQHARVTRSASEAYQEGKGVCRDYAHLAIAFCRAMNIPARYCTGYLGDVGLLPPYPPGDFAAWMEVFIEGRWHTFDPRNNTPRSSRILIARGRDAADVPISATFGPSTLKEFRVWVDEAPDISGRAAGL